MDMPAVGDAAPGIALPDETGTIHDLSAQRGRWTIVYFYPADDTPGCTVEACEFRDSNTTIHERGADVWGISPQGVQSHEDFSCKHGGFPFPLLADTSKNVGKDYGIVGPMGFYRRSVFVVDAEGVIRYAHRALSGLTYRPTTELVDAVKAAQSVGDPPAV